MWDGAPLPRELFAARRDRVPLEIKFMQSGFRDLPEGAYGRAGIKIEGQQGGQYLAYSESWLKSGVGRDAVYTFVIDLNTLNLESLFLVDPAPAFVAAILEMEWGYPIGGAVSRETSLPVKVRIANDYINGNEDEPSGVPDGKATQAEAEAGADNQKWMTPLRTAQAITALAGHSTFVGATPPTPAVNGTIWIDSATYRAHVLFEGIWTEISTP